MEAAISKIKQAIEDGEANLIYRDGAFWPGPPLKWDQPSHSQLFHINVKEKWDEQPGSCTQSSDSR